jgi:hypothetical protein
VEIVKKGIGENNNKKIIAAQLIIYSIFLPTHTYEQVLNCLVEVDEAGNNAQYECKWAAEASGRVALSGSSDRSLCSGGAGALF